MFLTSQYLSFVLILIEVSNAREYKYIYLYLLGYRGVKERMYMYVFGAGGN